MAYTVKQLAGPSGVSVRTLHFYDEVGLLRPAYIGANGHPRLAEFAAAGMKAFAERELS